MLFDFKDRPGDFNPNCTDPLGRTALIVAIENESYELVEALLDTPAIRVGDALLHAINEDFVEAVELLLDWEETHHKDGMPYVSPVFHFFPIRATNYGCI